MSWIKASPEGAILSIRVIPRASKNEVQGLHGDALKIRLRAPPVDGKANEALIGYLAEILDVPTRQIVLLHGATGRNKRVLARGISEAATRAAVGNP